MSRRNAFNRSRRRTRPILSASPRSETSGIASNSKPVLSKKFLFQWAWQLSRDAAKSHGGPASDFFSESLREAWTKWKSDPVVKLSHRMASYTGLVSSSTSLDQDKLLAAADRAQQKLGTIYTKAF